MRSPGTFQSTQILKGLSGKYVQQGSLQVWFLLKNHYVCCSLYHDNSRNIVISHTSKLPVLKMTSDSTMYCSTCKEKLQRKDRENGILLGSCLLCPGMFEWYYMQYKICGLQLFDRGSYNKGRAVKMPLDTHQCLRYISANFQTCVVCGFDCRGYNGQQLRRITMVIAVQMCTKKEK